ncbi:MULTISPECIES: hypothetical protein [Actinomadura]|uniref:Uncharacterized protein n=1 Tax=Actinomadura bangladeshensis TaxID=453573 RepID=A0A6L9QDU8_9ACTN|nr:hypothetical protein [Actinomadura bangladeshensis]NEA23425.1 hypothetical protein [Actinomadura bangladeshensis]
MTSNASATSRNAQVDHETEQLAEDLESAVHSLKRAVEEPGGLAGPATAFTVLDAAHTAATELDQLLLHLERFLAHQHADGRLVRDHGGSLDGALDDFGRAILHARHLGAGCGEAINQARSAINHVHGTGSPPATSALPLGGTATEPAPTAPIRRDAPRVTPPDCRGLRARWFGIFRKGA